MTQSRSGTDPVFKLAQQRVNKLLKKIRAEAQASATDPYTLSPALVHSLRVCTKRLRALLQLYRPVAGKTAIKAVDQSIRALANAYSGQRDAVVQYETLGHLVDQYQQSHGSDMQPLLDHFQARLDDKAESASPLEPEAAFTAILERWQQKLKGKKQPDFESGLEYAYRKARKLAYEAEASDDDEVYHQCRKWTKYYLYQLQMLVDKPRPRDKALIKQLKELGERLGLFHDRCVLEQAMNRMLNQGLDNEALEQAVLLMLTWLMEQKRQDKKQCQEWFEGVFSRPHNGVKLKG
ncbi:MAG: CHAD domain-containing protein [Pseudomonadota bacterium]|nr:CHAD domain-containing protein [Pseudomonadota bacterium]